MSAARRVPVIGLLGGIGSGKTFLARELARRHNIVIVEGDAAGHAVLKLEPVKTALRSRFGPAVFTPEGEVDRRALGRQVFGAGETERQARTDLEQIVHPRIRELLANRIAQARLEPTTEAVVLDAAILLEAGWRHLCDALIFLDVPDEQRLQRVLENRGWSANEFLTREASQLSLELKKGESQYVVDNSGSPEQAVNQLEQIYSQIMDDLA